MTGIYKIESISHPERIYIGSAVDIQKRMQRHIYDLNRNKHHSLLLQRHYNKYGREDLEFSLILNNCRKEELLFIEQIFITPKPYFNSSPTVGSRLGIKSSKETIEKHRQFMIGKKYGMGNKGKKHSQEQNDATSVRNKLIGNKPPSRLGCKKPEELKSKRAYVKKGRHTTLSEEHKNNIRLSLLGKASPKKGKTYV